MWVVFIINGTQQQHFHQQKTTIIKGVTDYDLIGHAKWGKGWPQVPKFLTVCCAIDLAVKSSSMLDIPINAAPLQDCDVQHTTGNTEHHSLSLHLSC